MCEFDETFKGHFVDVLKTTRKNQHLSQEEISHRCGLSTRQFGNLESGKNIPKTKTLINMVIGFGLNVDEIVKRMLEDGYSAENK